MSGKKGALGGADLLTWLDSLGDSIMGTLRDIRAEQAWQQLDIAKIRGAVSSLQEAAESERVAVAAQVRALRRDCCDRPGVVKLDEGVEGVEPLADDGDGGGLAAVVRRLAETADRIGALREDFGSFRLPSSESAGDGACGGTHNSSSVDIAGADTPACEPSIEGAPDGAGAAPSSLPRRPVSEGREPVAVVLCAYPSDGIAAAKLLPRMMSDDALIFPVADSAACVQRLRWAWVGLVIATPEATLEPGFLGALAVATTSMTTSALQARSES